MFQKPANRNVPPDNTINKSVGLKLHWRGENNNNNTPCGVNGAGGAGGNTPTPFSTMNVTQITN